MEGKTRDVVESFSLLLQPLPKRFYDKTELSQGFFTAELWRARSARCGAPWVRKSGYLCIHEILVLTKSSLRTYVHHFMLAGVKLRISSTPRVSVVNHMATGTLRERQREKTTTTTRKPSLSFDWILMSTLTWKTEKELKREILNNGDQFHWKKNIKILQAAVRKWEMITATKVKMCGNKKKVSGDTQHFLHKTCSRGKQRQRDVRKGAASCFLPFSLSLPILLYFVWVNYKYFRKRASLFAMANIFCDKEYVKFP